MTSIGVGVGIDYLLNSGLKEDIRALFDILFCGVSPKKSVRLIK